MKKILIYLCIIFAFVVSCRKDELINPNNCSYSNNLEQFVTVWEGLNSAYPLWQYDTTDWDRIYEKYYHLFKDERISDSVWKSYWIELTSSLLDHHTQIVLKRPTSSAYVILSPGLNEVRSRPYYHTNVVSINRYNMILGYKSDNRLTDDTVSMDGSTMNACAGLLDGDIAYLSLPKFNIRDQISKNAAEAFRYFKFMVGNKETVRAAIVDLRGNGGGNVFDIHEFISCFTDKPVLFGYIQKKVGLGRHDLGPKIPSRAYPDNGNKTDIPIIILVDVNSASMSEIAALAVKQLPSGYVVGERTYGGFSPLVENNFEYGFAGGFGRESILSAVLDGGHYVYMPFSCFTTVDGKCPEGIGVIPDRECLFDSLAWSQGIDNQLEEAIIFARSKMAK